MTAASTSRESTATAAGIVERAGTQERVIPESRRADGSIRKERKVRPGYTPVEDVLRYRPGKAREAEEARKRGVAASAAQSVAPTASRLPTASPPTTRAPTSATCDSDPPAWRSNAAGPSAASDGGNGSQQQRGNFAPLEPPRPLRERKSAGRAPLSASETPSSAAKPWQNSRLRKPPSPKLNPEESAVAPGVWDQDKAEPGAKLEKRAGADKAPPRAKASADDLISSLDSLSIGNRKSKGDDR